MTWYVIYVWIYVYIYIYIYYIYIYNRYILERRSFLRKILGLTGDTEIFSTPWANTCWKYLDARENQDTLSRWKLLGEGRIAWPAQGNYAAAWTLQTVSRLWWSGGLISGRARAAFSLETKCLPRRRPWPSIHTLSPEFRRKNIL